MSMHEDRQWSHPELINDQIKNNQQHEDGCVGPPQNHLLFDPDQ